MRRAACRCGVLRRALGEIRVHGTHGSPGAEMCGKPNGDRTGPHHGKFGVPDAITLGPASQLPPCRNVRRHKGARRAKWIGASAVYLFGRRRAAARRCLPRENVGRWHPSIAWPRSKPSARSDHPRVSSRRTPFGTGIFCVQTFGPNPFRLILSVEYGHHYWVVTELGARPNKSNYGRLPG